jgi:hypothetical protein
MKSLELNVRHNNWKTTVIGVLSLALLGSAVAADTGGDVACEFRPAGKDWKASCEMLFGETRTLTLSPTQKIRTGTWRKGTDPTSVWAGEMTESGSPNWPIELEIYDKGTGLLRTEYGWFPVSAFSVNSGTLRFKIDVAKQVSPNDLDRKIIERAAEILSAESAWNRADTRKCNPTDTRWSIYCAEQRACVEVTGGFHHRRPALELVRQIVDERSVGRNYHHRLMDYNNDPSTRFDDVQSLFGEALSRMKR